MSRAEIFTQHTIKVLSIYLKVGESGRVNTSESPVFPLKLQPHILAPLTLTHNAQL